MTKHRPWIEARILLDRDGMTQTHLAREMGISISYLSDIMVGRKHPNGRIINLAAKVLKVPKSMLIPAEDADA